MKLTCFVCTVFLPRIKKTVREFAAAHNNHAVHTEGNLTPLQLLHLNSHLIPLHQPTLSSDADANVPESVADLSVVDVLQTTCPLTDDELEELKQEINPLSEIPHMEIYNSGLQFVGRKMIARQN